MAERRSFREIIEGRVRFTDRTSEKRSTGYNFFRDDVNENVSFIQGYNTTAGNWNIDGLGDGQSNSAVVACLGVLGVSFSEATLQVCVKDTDGDKELVPNHPFSYLMRRPNPYMSGDVIQNYIINAMHVSGDAYLLKQFNEVGQLVSLYPLMPDQITPKGSSEELITHYIYETQEDKFRLEINDIVHFRLGLDPTNHKQGFSPLKSVLREIYGDESAGQMATALLSNMGVPSVMITPKDEYGPSKEEAEQIAKTYQQKVSGKNKGKPLVLSGQMNVEKLSFSPKDLDIGLLRQVPEERISAVLGVPAILAGLGAGLKNATYSNAKELREFFTENKLIPLWRMVGEELTQQVLLKDYEEDNDSYYAEYDFSEVRALQSDQNELFERLNTGVAGGWITVAEAREKVGLPVNDSQEVYLLSQSVVPTPADLIMQEESQIIDLQVENTPEVIIEDDVQYSSKVIRKIEDQFCVIAEESGRNMGCYATRELAERRLRQIEGYSDNPKKQKKNNKPIEDTYSFTQDGSRVHNSWLNKEDEEE